MSSSLGHFFTAFILVLGFLLPGGAGARVTADRIVVKKSQKTMDLMKGDRVLKTYLVSLGRNSSDGPKEREGDLRTPEGRYKITAHNRHSDFYYSLRVSYPNAENIEKAKSLGVEPGGDIMIHGLPQLKEFERWGLPKNWADYRIVKWHYLINWTEGCIAVTNAEIKEIAKMAPPGTEIEIQP